MPIIHRFNGNDFDDFLTEMCKTLESEITDDTINLSPHIGSGFIKNVAIEPNFCIRYFNCTFKDDFDFETFSSQPESALIYKLHYNLDKVDPLQDTSKHFHNNTTNVLMYSIDFERKGIIKKGINFRRIMILFDTA